MTSERRPEIPTGFVWKGLSGTKGEVPMPEGWFYLNLNAPGTRAYFLTPEPLAKTGILTRGLTVNLYLGFGRRLGRSATDFSVHSLANPGLEMFGVVANGPLEII